MELPTTKVYGENTSVGFRPKKVYDENTRAGFGPDKVYDENTSVGFAPDKDTGPNRSAAEQPSWKANLSKRWSKKLPTKADLCDSLLDTKLSLTVQSRLRCCFLAAKHLPRCVLDCNHAR